MATHGHAGTFAVVASVALIAFAIAIGCDGTTSPRLHPQVSGRIQLIGHERNATCDQTGTRVVDPTGAPVYLFSNRTVVDSTESVGGHYFFDDVPAGTYLAYTEVIPTVFDTTGHFVVGDDDVFVGDTLKLRSSGVGLVTCPNPPSGQATLKYSVDEAGAVLLELVDVSLVFVRDLVDGHMPAGEHAAVWDGNDASGSPVPPGSYWAIRWLWNHEHVDLVFVSD